MRDKTLLRHLSIIAALSTAVYSNSLQNGFVYDDIDLIVRCYWIRDISYIPEIFTHGYFMDVGVVKHYRPVVHMIHMAEYHVFGLNPAGFHFINIFLHVCVSILVYLLAAKLGARDNRPSNPGLSFPFVTAMLFAATPIHTDAVTWVTGLHELSFAFFYLLSLYLYITAVTNKHGRALFAFSLVSYFLACLCKETALTLLLLILCYEHFYRKSGEKAASYVKRYLPFIALTIIYAAMRLNALGTVALRYHEELDTWGYVINVFPLFKDYLLKLVFPVNLNVLHVFHPVSSVTDIEVIISIAAVLVFAVSLLIAAKRKKHIFIALLFIAVPLLPTLYIPAFPDNVFAERYLYLPSVGFAMLTAIPIVWLGKQGRAALAAAVLVAVLCLYSAQTIMRNTVWKNDYSLWSDTVLKSPDSPMAHMNLGEYYFKKGNLEKAAEEFNTAVRLGPNFARTHYNMGVLYAEKGLTKSAIDEYEIAVKLNPYYAEAHNNLGTLYRKTGQSDKAAEEFRALLRIDPKSVNAHYYLGNISMDNGRIDEAINELQAASRLAPDYANAHQDLGIAYLKENMTEKAVGEFKAALWLNPDNADLHYNLGLLQLSRGLKEDALSEFEIASRLKPEDPEIRKKLDSLQGLRQPVKK